MTEMQKSAFVGTALRRGIGLANKGMTRAGGVLAPIAESKPVRLAGGAMKARGHVMRASQAGQDAASVLRQAQRTAEPPRGVRDVIPQGGMTALAALNMMKEAAGETSPAFITKSDRMSFRRGATGALGAAAVGAGVSALGLVGTMAARGVGGMFERSQRNKLFQEVSRRDPQIARDPRAREYFDLVMTYAPSLGRHPTAIADFLKKQLMYPVSSTEFLHALANFESTVKQNLEKGPSRQVGLAFEEGARGYAGDYIAHHRKMEQEQFKHRLRKSDD